MTRGWQGFDIFCVVVGLPLCVVGLIGALAARVVWNLMIDPPWAPVAVRAPVEVPSLAFLRAAN